jgi:hypothetical protein
MESMLKKVIAMSLRYHLIGQKPKVSESDIWKLAAYFGGKKFFVIITPYAKYKTDFFFWYIYIYINIYYSFFHLQRKACLRQSQKRTVQSACYPKLDSNTVFK